MKIKRRHLFKILLWKLGLFKINKSNYCIPKSFHKPLITKRLNCQKPYVVWINHCTFLVRYKNICLLTDPIWSEECSPSKIIGPKRHHKPALDLNQIPNIDYVLISHNHYDHLDKKTVQKLNFLFPKIIWIVPCGLKKWFKKLKITNVIELNWWHEQKFQLNQLEVKFTAIPAQHYSGRGIFDFNKSLYNGYVAEFTAASEVKRLYFSGDTGYDKSNYIKMNKLFDHFDLSLLPIGTYSPREFMKPIHLHPKEAVLIHKTINSNLSLGMHWKTFHLSEEPLEIPPYELYCALKKENMDVNSFLAIDPGSYVNW